MVNGIEWILNNDADVHYNDTENTLYIDGVRVFDNGKFAEVVKETELDVYKKTHNLVNPLKDSSDKECTCTSLSRSMNCIKFCNRTETKPSDKELLQKSELNKNIVEFLNELVDVSKKQSINSNDLVDEVNCVKKFINKISNSDKELLKECFDVLNLICDNYKLTYSTRSRIKNVLTKIKQTLKP